MNDQLERYLALLLKYRKRVNLTGTRDEGEIRTLIKDSLVSFPQEGHVLDLGTGGGLPGLPLLLTHPGLRMAFLDKSRKKMNILALILQQLEIPFPLLLTGEASRFTPEYHDSFDHVVSRGMGETVFVLEQAAPFLKEGGLAWLWKPAGYRPVDVKGTGNHFTVKECLECSLCSVAVYGKRDGEG